MDTNTDIDSDINVNENFDNEEEFIQYGGWRTPDYDGKFKTTVASVYVLDADSTVNPDPNVEDTEDTEDTFVELKNEEGKVSKSDKENVYVALNNFNDLKLTLLTSSFFGAVHYILLDYYMKKELKKMI